MATAVEDAQLSNRVYARTERNRTPVPAGWTELSWTDNSRLSGFSAGVYRKGSEIVIAYTGTNERGFVDFALANIPAAVSIPSAQVTEAMLLYLDVKRQYPGAEITFTGHSLGGGLASLMAVFFDRPATIFNPAPFELTARNLATLGLYQIELARRGYTDAAFNAFTGNVDGALFSQREAQVTAYCLQGEILADLRAIWPTIQGTEVVVPIGRQSYLDGALPFTPRRADAHSMSLLTAMLVSPAFAEMVQRTSSALALFFDETLYRTDPQRSIEPNFLDRLLIAHLGDPAAGVAPVPVLERFAADVLLLAGDTGLAQTQARDALIAAAVEHHYQRADAAPCFTVSEGHLSFDPGALVGPGMLASLSASKAVPRLQQALFSAFGADAAYTAQLAGCTRWHIQQGAAAMHFTGAGSANDAAVGGVHGDFLDGGAGDDVLVGNAGADALFGGQGDDLLLGGLGDDFLAGGAGADRLLGGLGRDSYHLSNSDTHTDVIEDADNSGRLIVDGVGIGSFSYRARGLYVSDNGQFLLINTRGGASADLYRIADGRRLCEIRGTTADKVLDYTLQHSSAQAPVVVAGTNAGDLQDIGRQQREAGGGGSTEPGYWLADGGGGPDVQVAGTYETMELGGGEGNDWLYGAGLGDDRAALTVLDGGAGSDFLSARGGTNLVNGGGGNDFISTCRYGYAWVPALYSPGQPGDVIPVSFYDPWAPFLLPLILGSLPSVTPQTDASGNVGRFNLAQDGRLSFFFNAFGTGSGVATGTLYATRAWEVGLGGLADALVKLSTTESQTSKPEWRVISWQALDEGELMPGSNGPLPSITLRLRRADGAVVTVYVPKSLVKPEARTSEEQLRDGHGNDNDMTVVDAGDGNDIVEGGAGRDVVSGGSGDDRIDGAGGLDVLYGDAGHDFIAGGAYSDVLYGGAGDDRLIGDYPEDADGNAVLPQHLLGDDELHGDEGNDFLWGNGGNDRLFGGNGSDTLAGGAGDDLLVGGDDGVPDPYGSDTYVYRRGDGHDVIIESDRSSTSVDTLIFEGDIAPADIVMRRVGHDLVFDVAGTQAAVTVRNHFSDDGSNSILLEQVQFQSQPGLSWRLRHDLGVTIEGGELPPGSVVVGTLYDDELNGPVRGGTLRGGAGDDVLRGGNGEDILDGGPGNDTLIGRGGDNVYRFGRGDGEDIIVRPAAELLRNPDGTYRDARNVIEFKSGVRPEDLAFAWHEGIELRGLAELTTYSRNLLITIRGSADSILIPDLRGGLAGLATPFWLRFADVPGFEMGSTTIADLAKDDEYWSGYLEPASERGGLIHQTLLGTEAGDVLTGARNNTRLEGRGGNDVLDGGGGNDELDGGDGDDVLLGGSGFDELFGGAGNDRLDGGTGHDELDGGAGNDTLIGGEGHDSLVDRDGGDDVFDGGPGDDVIGLSFGVNLDSPHRSIAPGNDTYIFRRGSGADVVIDHDADGAGYNTVRLESLTPADIEVYAAPALAQGGAGAGEHLGIRIRGTQDRLIITNFLRPWDDSPLKPGGADASLRPNGFAGRGPTPVLTPQELPQPWRFEFADGTVWSFDDVVARLADGTDGSECLTRGSADDVIHGRGGDDDIYAGAGNDTIDGGPGSDVIYASRGRDTILFGRGDGRDYVTWNHFNRDADRDVLQFKPGVAPGDVEIAYEGDALVLRIRDTSDEVRFHDNAYGQFRIPNSLLEVRFADAPHVVWDAATIEAALSGAPAGRWNPDTNTVVGTNGDDDPLHGPYGSVVRGLAGNDRIYVPAAGIGEGGPGNDRYVLGVGSEGAVLERPEEGIDWVESFAPSTTLPANVENLVLGVNIFNGAPTGAFNGTGNDSDNIIYGNLLDNVLDGGGGDDLLFGFGGADTLRGAAGADRLYGGDGADILIGGGGDDILLSNGQGATFVFDRGDGRDVIHNSSAQGDALGVLAFGAGVSASDVQLSRGAGLEGDDLLIGIAGTTDEIRVKDHFALFGAARGSGLSTIRFADGTTWDRAAIDRRASSPTPSPSPAPSPSPPPSPSPVPPPLATIPPPPAPPPTHRWIEGTEGGEALEGDALNDGLLGHGGNDSLSGWDGDDLLYGGAGDDFLWGWNGNDWLEGGDGFDMLGGAWGNDYLNGGAGYDSLYGEDGDDYLDGGETGPDPYYGDTLIGGAGNDILVSNGGGAVFQFGPDSGSDVIYNFAVSTEARGHMEVYGGAKSDPGNVVLTRGAGANGNDLIVSFLGSDDIVVVKDHFATEGGLRTRGISLLRIGESIYWDRLQIDARAAAAAAATGPAAAGDRADLSTTAPDVTYASSADDRRLAEPDAAAVAALTGERVRLPRPPARWLGEAVQDGDHWVKIPGEIRVVAADPAGPQPPIAVCELDGTQAEQTTVVGAPHASTGGVAEDSAMPAAQAPQRVTIPRRPSVRPVTAAMVEAALADLDGRAGSWLRAAAGELRVIAEQGELAPDVAAVHVPAARDARVFNGWRRVELYFGVRSDESRAPILGGEGRDAFGAPERFERTPLLLAEERRSYRPRARYEALAA